MNKAILAVLTAFFTLGSIKAQDTEHYGNVRAQNLPNGATIDTLVTQNSSGDFQRTPYTSLFAKLLADIGQQGGAETDPVHTLWLGTPSLTNTLNMNSASIQGTPGSGSSIDMDNLNGREFIAYDAGGYGTANVQVQGPTGSDRLHMRWNVGDAFYEFGVLGGTLPVRMSGDFQYQRSIAQLDAAADSTLVHKGWVNSKLAGAGGWVGTATTDLDMEDHAINDVNWMNAYGASMAELYIYENPTERPGFETGFATISLSKPGAAGGNANTFSIFSNANQSRMRMYSPDTWGIMLTGGDYVLDKTIAEINAAPDSTLVSRAWVEDHVANSGGGGGVDHSVNVELGNSLTFVPTGDWFGFPYSAADSLRIWPRPSIAGAAPKFEIEPYGGATIELNKVSKLEWVDPDNPATLWGEYASNGLGVMTLGAYNGHSLKLFGAEGIEIGQGSQGENITLNQRPVWNGGSINTINVSPSNVLVTKEWVLDTISGAAGGGDAYLANNQTFTGSNTFDGLSTTVNSATFSANAGINVYGGIKNYAKYGASSYYSGDIKAFHNADTSFKNWLLFGGYGTDETYIASYGSTNRIHFSYYNPQPGWDYNDFAYMDGTGFFAPINTLTLQQEADADAKMLTTVEYLRDYVAANGGGASGPAAIIKANEGAGDGFIVDGWNRTPPGPVGENSFDLVGYDGLHTIDSVGVQAVSSMGFGWNNLSTGYWNFVGGSENIVRNTASFAMGYQNTATGWGSTAFGFLSDATGTISLAAGYDADASGYNAAAYGLRTRANGNYSYTAGILNETNSDGDVTLGAGLISTSSNAMTNFGQVVLGRANVQTDLAPLVVGNGSLNISDPDEFNWSVTGRSNALVVYNDGTIDAPSLSTAEIDAGAGTLLTTKEWVEGFEWSAVPASATATGTPGEKAYDANYLYICTATDTWVRVALSTW